MSAVRVVATHEGQVLRVTLARPKANVLDAEMVGQIRAMAASTVAAGPLKLIVFAGEGRHFSFGAAVDEHLPGKVARMIGEFGEMFREIEALGVPTAAVVRGQCLGGGFELATGAGRVFCDATAHFALPEVVLGVFPPVAAVMLPWRVRGPDAARLMIGGRGVDGPEAVRIGLADVLAEDPELALEEWFEHELAPHSAVAIRMAWQALRRPIRRALDVDLPAVEQLYLQDLMACRDPAEGLHAFLDKRSPHWEHR